jgi:hypothetical protein
MSRLLVVLTVAAFACKTGPKVRAPDDDPKTSSFQALADGLATPAQPLWPTLPEALTTDLRKGATAPADAAGRLAAARSRLAGWTLDLVAAKPEAIGAKLRVAYEGVFLAEPLAYGAPSADALAAAGLLHHLYDVVDTTTFRDWAKAAPNIGLDRKLLEVLADNATTQRKHLAAQILTAGAPADAVDGVLRSLAERARNDTDYAKAKTLFTQLVERRGERATLDDWLDLSTAQLRTDDRAGTASSLEKARKLPVPDRLSEAKLREAGKDLANLDRYIKLKENGAVEARIEQLDLLRAMGRSPEADALLKQLKDVAPNDARVRVRSAAMGFEGMAAAGNMMAAAGYVAQELGEATLVNKDADYWSMLIGAQGAHAMGEALPLLFQDRIAGGKKMVEILKTMRGMAVELEKTRPGRAAALQYVIDHTIPIVEKGTAQDVAVADLLRTGLADAVALRAKYPDTIDLDRLVFTFAAFTKDRQHALDVVMQRPGTPPTEDIELYQSRARTALTLAIVIATPAAVASARSAVTDIAPSWSSQIEANREAMLGDCDAIEATLKKDDALWAKAAGHYEAARTMHKEVRARVTNNLGWIALKTGTPEGADALFRESAEDDTSGRRWLAFLNALATPARANERLEGLRSLILANSTDGKPPETLLVWLAATSQDPKESGEAAARVLEVATDAFAMIKPANSAIGFETEGAFQVGIGLASRKFYDLNTQAYASLWLMPPLPLDAAQLAAKAKTVAPKKPPKPPKKK